ncbi:MAG TPA: tRNA (adenosine(37)-N6)-threonylcarbamoyltransferase complex ATPase subunit type 1 TsaE [Bacteroidia bacterium]|nr:tRNA (adenosine(37)-N6)-threonylcarbamoyltransferase complex ATPase subunit type 1 TsaE [Bacteroidia bacterium]
MSWIVDKEIELESIAQQILAKCNSQRVFTFSGNLGSGKTTFIKYLCKVLGVKEQVTSPTFALVNEYLCANKLKIYHFDFYRIKNIQEAYDMGYEEYFYSGNYCFIEWPELIKELVPKDSVNISIEVDDGKREIKLNTI